MARSAMRWWAAGWLAAAGCGEAGEAATAVRSCVYVNGFTGTSDCREYHGAWSEADARAECDAQEGELVDGACAEPATLGTCVLAPAADREVRVVLRGEDLSQCPVMVQVCGTFLRGAFEPTEACADRVDDPVPDETAEVEPVCVDPVAGEPAGQGPGGAVCTLPTLQGCTEAGRNYADYVSCEPSYAQRGYYADPPAPDEGVDPRMDDPAYAAEVEWLREQLTACSCVCCHQGSATPAGAVIWDLEVEGNFLNSFSPWGLAFMAGFVDSSILGSAPAGRNNGFDRDVTGMPTTDPQRVLEFFTAELAARGYAPDDEFD